MYVFCMYVCMYVCLCSCVYIYTHIQIVTFRSSGSLGVQVSSGEFFGWLRAFGFLEVWGASDFFTGPLDTQTRMMEAVTGFEAMFLVEMLHTVGRLLESSETEEFQKPVHQRTRPNRSKFPTSHFEDKTPTSVRFSC